MGVFEENLIATRYLNFLRFQLVLAHGRSLSKNVRHQNIWFQYDGAPPHFGSLVSEYLDVVFSKRWIAQRGPIE